MAISNFCYRKIVHFFLEDTLSLPYFICNENIMRERRVQVVIMAERKKTHNIFILISCIREAFVPLLSAGHHRTVSAQNAAAEQVILADPKH